MTAVHIFLVIQKHVFTRTWGTSDNGSGTEEKSISGFGYTDNT